MTVADSIFKANQEMAALMLAAWGSKPCDWPNMVFTPPAKDIVWARWRVQYDDGRQSTLADTNGKRRWSRAGIVTVQVFTPLNIGVETYYNSAETVVGAYQGKRTPSGVWFRNVRIAEIPTELAWQQINVYADFEFEQIR